MSLARSFDPKPVRILVSIVAAFVTIVSANAVRADSTPIKVELVWTMPDTLVVLTAEMTRTERSVTDWNLAAIATEAAQKALGPKFIVTRYQGDVSQIANVAGDLFDPAFKKIGKLLQQLPNPNRVDAYLLVTPGSVQHPARPAGNWVMVGGEDWTLNGYGLYRHKSLIGPRYGEHAALYLQLFDAQTGFRTGYAASCLRDKDSCSFSLVMVDETTWAETADLLTPQQMATLKNDFIWLTHEGIIGGLIKMKRASPEALARAPDAKPSRMTIQW